MKIKKYIDYLFWKRTWFRMIFILLPTFAITLALCINNFFGFIFNINKIIMTVCFVLLIAAMADNKSVDAPENPFKKQNL